MSQIRLVAGLVVFAATMPAQNHTLFFTVNQIEVSATGAGGSNQNPGNETAIFHRSSIVAAAPDPGAFYAAYELCDIPTWSAHVGDENGNGNFVQAALAQVDALQVVPGAPHPPSLFDFYLSTNIATGPSATLAPGGFEKADIVRFRPGGGFDTFLSRQQISDALGTPVGSTYDVNGFTIDPATGDMYWTTSGTYMLNGSVVEDGAVARLAAGMYVVGASGNVISVVPGSVELVLTDAEVHGMYLAAGLNGISDLSGLAVAPGGGIFTSQSTGKTLPHLWMTDRDVNDGAVIVSTALGGSVASLPGVSLGSGPALGLGSSGFNVGVAPGALTALDVVAVPLTTTPRMLDMTNAFIPALTPFTLQLDVGGLAPQATALIFASLADSGTPGGFPARVPTLSAANPFGNVFTGPGGFPELYQFDLADPLFLSTIATPFVIVADLDGYGRLTLPLPPVPSGVSAVFQFVEVPTLTLSPPVMPDVS